MSEGVFAPLEREVRLWQGLWPEAPGVALEWLAASAQAALGTIVGACALPSQGADGTDEVNGAGEANGVSRAEARDGATGAGAPDALAPFRIDYVVRWDEAGETSDVEIALERAGGVRHLRLVRDADGSWRDGTGARLDALDGCRDVDIWPTPFTNSLPLRRLRLGAGERRELDVIWIDALQLSWRRATQAYTRTGADRFRFEALESDFTAELQVDRHGLVIDYPELFRRVG